MDFDIYKPTKIAIENLKNAKSRKIDIGKVKYTDSEKKEKKSVYKGWLSIIIDHEELSGLTRAMSNDHHYDYIIINNKIN